MFTCILKSFELLMLLAHGWHSLLFISRISFGLWFCVACLGRVLILCLVPTLHQVLACTWNNWLLHVTRFSLREQRPIPATAHRYIVLPLNSICVKPIEIYINVCKPLSCLPPYVLAIFMQKSVLDIGVIYTGDCVSTTRRMFFHLSRYVTFPHKVSPLF